MTVVVTMMLAVAASICRGGVGGSGSVCACGNSDGASVGIGGVGVVVAVAVMVVTVVVEIMMVAEVMSEGVLMVVDTVPVAILVMALVASMVMLVVVEEWWCLCLWQQIGGCSYGGGVSEDGCGGSDCSGGGLMSVAVAETAVVTVALLQL
jgi:hypothetical protein